MPVRRCLVSRWDYFEGCFLCYLGLRQEVQWHSSLGGRNVFAFVLSLLFGSTLNSFCRFWSLQETFVWVYYSNYRGYWILLVWVDLSVFISAYLHLSSLLDVWCKSLALCVFFFSVANSRLSCRGIMRSAFWSRQTTFSVYLIRVVLLLCPDGYFRFAPAMFAVQFIVDNQYLYL